MAIQFADGFDLYGGNAANMTGEYSGINTAYVQLDNTIKRTGAYSLHIGEHGGVLKVLPIPTTSLGIAAAIYIPNLPNAGNGFFPCIGDLLAADASEICHFNILPNGAIRATRNGTVLGTSNPCINPGVFNHVEIYTFSDHAVGAIEIRVNSGTVLTIVNANTSNSGDTSIAMVQWFASTIGLGGMDLYFDDLIIWDTSGGTGFLGDRRCLTFLPNSDVAPSQWTPNAGATSYTQIDDPVPDDTDYITSDTVGQKATFGLGDLPANASDIAAIIIKTRLSKDDASDCAIRSSFITGVVQAQSADMHPAIGYQTLTKVFDKNPLTNAHWTPAEFNAGFLQLERTI